MKLDANILKFSMAVVLVAVWAALVFTGKAPVDAFLEMLKDALIGLGAYHAGASFPASPASGVVSAVSADSKQGGFVHLRLLIVLAVASIALMLSACATTSMTTKTPEQIAADIQVAGQKFCTVAQPTLVSLQALTLDDKATAALATAQGVVTVVCKAGAVIQVTDLSTMANTALPAIISAIKASPLDDDDKTTAVLGVTAANVAINSAIQTAASQK